MANKKKTAVQKKRETPTAEPWELATRFAQKKRGEPERQARLAKLRQQESTYRGKIALERIVIPYLQKVQDKFYEMTNLSDDFLFCVSQLDPRDRRPLGVYFRLSGSSTIVISIGVDSIITEKVDENGHRVPVYSNEEKPFVETYADLTEENIGELISRMIDEMPNENTEATGV